MRKWTTNYYARMDHGTSDKNNKQFTLEARGARVISIRLRFNVLPHKSFPFWTRNMYIFQEQSIRHRVHMCAPCTTINITHTECQILDRLLSNMLHIENFQKKIKSLSFFNGFYVSFNNMDLQRIS